MTILVKYFDQSSHLGLHDQLHVPRFRLVAALKPKTDHHAVILVAPGYLARFHDPAYGAVDAASEAASLAVTSAKTCMAVLIGASPPL
jgi:hypothetical protein